MGTSASTEKQSPFELIEGDGARSDSIGTSEQRSDRLSTEKNYVSVAQARRALSHARSVNETTIVACALALAAALEGRYRSTWGLEDVEERIQLYEEASGLLSVIHGGVQRDRHLAPGPGSILFLTNTPPSSYLLEDVERDVQLFGVQRALATCQSGLSCALGNRYKCMGTIMDIERQVRLCRDVLSSLSKTDPSRAEACYRLGAALRTIHEASGSAANLQEAIFVIEDALRLCTDEHAEPVYLCDLGCALAKRYRAAGDNADLFLAIDHQRRALRICPSDHSGRYACLYGLGDSLWLHFISTRTLPSVKEAITLHHEALEQCKPGHRDRQMVLNGLGVAYSVLYNNTAAMEHLSTAIGYHREALALRPRNHPDRGKSLSNLATSLRLRFTELGHMADLKDAVKLFEEFYDLYPPEHPLHRYAVNSLANTLQYLYYHGGDGTHLEEAVRLQRVALEMHSVDEVARAGALNNLGDALRLRYMRYRSLDDLTESIDVLREALTTTSPTHIGYGTYISNLTLALTFRAEETSNAIDIEEAIDLSSRWLETGAPEDNLRSSYLHRLAGARLLRFKLLKEAQDLDRAEQLLRKALSLRPTGHPRRDHVVIGLASILRLKFEATGSQEDAIDALQLLEELPTLHPFGHPRRASGLCETAQLFISRGTPFYNIERGLGLVQASLNDPHRNAQNRLIDAVEILQDLTASIANVHLTEDLRRQLLLTYTIVIRLLPQVAYFGLDIHSRLRVLTRAENLASMAAVLAVDTPNPHMAIEILEQGRGVFWTQYLRLRTPFDDLPTELAEKLKEVSGQLERGSVQDSSVTDDGGVRTKMNVENDDARRRVLGDEFERLVIKARAQPGFDRFMLHDTFAHIAQVADQGHVLVLLATEGACRGILIGHLTRETTQIQLPGLDIERLRQMREHLDRINKTNRSQTENRGMKRAVPRNAEPGGNEILAELWSTVIHVVVGALGISRAEGRSRPRLFICATGAFTQLPLHAAGIYQKKSETESCSDYFVTSYTPTLGALLTARRNHKPVHLRGVRSLIAAVPKPSQGSLLPYSIGELELVGSIVKELASNGTSGSAYQSESAHCEIVDAAISDILSKLPSVNMLHLACHGRQHPSNPLESGFACSDGTLTVAKLMALNLPNAFFAFLSACDTAKGDKAQPDQVIHLAATMLFVGFKSVIGTFWSMGDVDGPKVAKRVYEELYRQGVVIIGPDVIPYALDAAVSELRSKGLHPSRWAPFVHIGM